MKPLSMRRAKKRSHKTRSKIKSRSCRKVIPISTTVKITLISHNKKRKATDKKVRLSTQNTLKLIFSRFGRAAKSKKQAISTKERQS